MHININGKTIAYVSEPVNINISKEGLEITTDNIHASNDKVDSKVSHNDLTIGESIDEKPSFQYNLTVTDEIDQIDPMKIMENYIYFLKSIGAPLNYESWSNDFKLSEIKNSYDKFLSYIKDMIDNIGGWNNLTYQDMKNLGFEKWKLDSGEIIMLIPLYLYSLIPEGLEVISIFGEKIVYDGTNIDNDERLGLLAYGIMLSKGNS